MLYYDESMLRVLPTAVGRSIKVDFNTINYPQGKFAREYVEVNLTKPIIGRVGLDGD